MKFKDCKNFETIPVIYGIKNVITNKWYIGSCVNMKARFHRHYYYLRKNKHHSTKLQRSFNMYGEDAFDIQILKVIEGYDKVELFEIENVYINSYNSIENGYNMIPASPTCTFKQSDEAIYKAAKTRMKSVVCINRFTNKVYKIYESLSAAARELHLQTTNISSVCKQQDGARYLGDYVFRYIEDYNPLENYIINTHHMKGVPKSEEWKIKARQNSFRAKKVFKYTLDGNLVKTYTSRLEAER